MKASNPNKKEWTSADPQFSEPAALKALMQTLPEVNAGADEEWKRKRIEYAPCPNFRR